MKGAIATIVVAIIVIVLFNVFHLVPFGGGCFDNNALQMDCR